MKNNLEPIPTPKEQLWKEFRVSYLPWIVMIFAIGITWMTWSRMAVSPTLMGEVESVRAQVVSPEVGIVEQVLVPRFSEVKRGDPLVVVRPTDRRSLLSSIQLELDLFAAHGTSDSRLTLNRAEADYYSLRLDLLAKRVDLEQSKVELERAEKDLVRSADLVEKNYLSKELYDISLAARDSSKRSVEELSALLPGLEQSVEKLRVEIESISSSMGSGTEFDSRIQALEQKLASVSSSENPITLIAPIDGMVSGIWCSPGEAVTEGYVLMMVNATEATRIVGYMRQPFPVEPIVGMPAKIVTHSTAQRILAVTEVETVGQFLEPITNSLARLTAEQTVDMGLPVSFKIPQDIKLRPGETVGLVLDRE